MREIKFREAIYKDGEFVKFHYWGYDDGGQSNAFLNSNRYVANLDSFPEDRKLYVKANEQYTGIKRDGKEIYEGDVLGKPNILGNKTRKGKVVFRNGCFFVDVYGQDNFYSILLHEYIKNDPKREIIGNVHENKEYGKAHI